MMTSKILELFYRTYTSNGKLSSVFLRHILDDFPDQKDHRKLVSIAIEKEQPTNRKFIQEVNHALH